MSRRTLICCAYPFGYGPAAKLLHIARHLRDSNLRLVFLGTGIAHELASRSNLFADVIEAAPDDERARTLLRSAAGLLSLMDRDYSALAAELGRPIFVADSLLWMRDRVPDVFQQAQRFWAQDFIGVRERLAEVGPNATPVGPIVTQIAPAPPQQRTRLVVNLGGGESPRGFTADDSVYFDFVLRGLLDSGLFMNGANAVLMAGAKCIRYLRSRYPDNGLEMISAAHEAALELLRHARLVLTAPGLTATLECFQLGIPTFFLPPQNYSQWWILHKLRERGLAPASFHWQDLWPDCSVTERLAENVRGPLVRDAIAGIASDKRADRLFADRLAAVRSADFGDLANKQRAFFETLGTDGAAQIAADLRRML